MPPTPAGGSAGSRGGPPSRCAGLVLPGSGGAVPGRAPLWRRSASESASLSGQIVSREEWRTPLTAVYGALLLRTSAPGFLYLIRADGQRGPRDARKVAGSRILVTFVVARQHRRNSGCRRGPKVDGGFLLVAAESGIRISGFCRRLGVGWQRIGALGERLLAEESVFDGGVFGFGIHTVFVFRPSIAEGYR